MAVGRGRSGCRSLGVFGGPFCGGKDVVVLGRRWIARRRRPQRQRGGAKEGPEPTERVGRGRRRFPLSGYGSGDRTVSAEGCAAEASAVVRVGRGRRVRLRRRRVRFSGRKAGAAHEARGAWRPPTKRVHRNGPGSEAPPPMEAVQGRSGAVAGHVLCGRPLCGAGERAAQRASDVPLHIPKKTPVHRGCLCIGGAAARAPLPRHRSSGAPALMHICGIRDSVPSGQKKEAAALGPTSRATSCGVRTDSARHERHINR